MKSLPAPILPSGWGTLGGNGIGPTLGTMSLKAGSWRCCAASHLRGKRMAERNKVGIIVHRWHPSVIGGSEALAWHYATLLTDRFEVDLLTTTATDAVLWKDDLPRAQRRQKAAAVAGFAGRGKRAATGNPFIHISTQDAHPFNQPGAIAPATA